MATAAEIINGLQIIAKHCDRGLEGLEVEGQHDIIYTMPAYYFGNRTEMKDPDDFPEEDKAELEKNGWHIHSEYGDKMWARHT